MAEAMVRRQLRPRNIIDPRVLEVMARVRREEFVLAQDREAAYRDAPLAIGEGQTISQPYIVALTCQLLELTGMENVLEIGTGLGYQAAVLSFLAGRVVTVEIRQSLVKQARERLKRAGYDNVLVVSGDGRQGYPPEAPFDAIAVAASGSRLPQAWRQQLKIGGRLVWPRQKRGTQVLERLVKTETGWE